MKLNAKIAIATSLIIVGATGYGVAGPFLTVQQLKIGIERQDSEKLSENIDFPALRSNLKEQISAMMVKKVGTELKDNPFGALGMMFASKMAESMVDSIITPSGIANLTAGGTPKPAQEGQQLQQQSESAPVRDPFRNARYTFDSQSKFSVWVKRGDANELRFVLTRAGLSWRLSNIVMPTT
jgi:hypothetical protein